MVPPTFSFRTLRYLRVSGRTRLAGNGCLRDRLPAHPRSCKPSGLPRRGDRFGGRLAGGFRCARCGPVHTGGASLDAGAQLLVPVFAFCATIVATRPGLVKPPGPARRGWATPATSGGLGRQPGVAQPLRLIAREPFTPSPVLRSEAFQPRRPIGERGCEKGKGMVGDGGLEPPTSPITIGAP